MEAKEKALKMCQAFGLTTLFAEDCNGGVTLPLSIAKKCALISVNEILDFMKDDDDIHKDCHFANSKWAQYYMDVKDEINKM